jgi:osmotically-inducible protein OsmY
MTRTLVRITAAAAACIALGGCAALVVGGAATGALMATDRRTAGTYVDDEAIEIRVQDRVYKKYGDKVHLNATSFNRTVLLTGEAPDEATRRDAEALARSETDVRALQNELTVGTPSRMDARTRDSYITSMVKARFVEAGKFQPNHVKVVTEARVVYLMGIVKRAEADAATQIARTTSDVAKVVRVFEYLD